MNEVGWEELLGPSIVAAKLFCSPKLPLNECLGM